MRRIRGGSKSTRVRLHPARRDSYYLGSTKDFVEGADRVALAIEHGKGDVLKCRRERAESSTVRRKAVRPCADCFQIRHIPRRPKPARSDCVRPLLTEPVSSGCEKSSRCFRRGGVCSGRVPWRWARGRERSLRRGLRAVGRRHREKRELAVRRSGDRYYGG